MVRRCYFYTTGTLLGASNSANREQGVKLAWTLCRGVACLMQRYKTTFTFCASSVGYVVANAEISKRKELLFTF